MHVTSYITGSEAGRLGVAGEGVVRKPEGYPYACGTHTGKGECVYGPQHPAGGGTGAGAWCPWLERLMTCRRLQPAGARSAGVDVAAVHVLGMGRHTLAAALFLPVFELPHGPRSSY